MQDPLPNHLATPHCGPWGTHSGTTAGARRWQPLQRGREPRQPVERRRRRRGEKGGYGSHHPAKWHTLRGRTVRTARPANTEAFWAQANDILDGVCVMTWLPFVSAFTPRHALWMDLTAARQQPGLRGSYSGARETCRPSRGRPAQPSVHTAPRRTMSGAPDTAAAAAAPVAGAGACVPP